MNIYVGNLAYNASEEQLRELFERFGEVISAKIPLDRDSGRSRGFGFVEMGDEMGQAAIAELNGSDFLGRPLRVNEARPREDKKGFRNRGPRDGGNRNYNDSY